jgi:hypothetical protein
MAAALPAEWCLAASRSAAPPADAARPRARAPSSPQQAPEAVQKSAETLVNEVWGVVDASYMVGPRGGAERAGG